MLVLILVRFYYQKNKYKPRSANSSNIVPISAPVSAETAMRVLFARNTATNGAAAARTVSRYRPSSWNIQASGKKCTPTTKAIHAETYCGLLRLSSAAPIPAAVHSNATTMPNAIEASRVSAVACKFHMYAVYLKTSPAVELVFSLF